MKSDSFNIDQIYIRRHDGTIATAQLISAKFIVSISEEQKNEIDRYYPSRMVKKDEMKILIPPGAYLNSFAEHFFLKKTYEQIYQPVIQEMWVEYIEALAAKQKWKARWVCARGYFSFFSAMVAHAPLSGLKLVKKIWTIVG